MKGDDESYSRIKDIHIEVCLHREVEASRTNGFEDVQLLPGFPTFSRKDIDTTADFLGKKLSLPLLISPITGGGRQSARINRNLATAAEHLGIAMAVGSERPMLERRVPSDSYLVRDCAPTVPLVANLGLVHAKRGARLPARSRNCHRRRCHHPLREPSTRSCRRKGRATTMARWKLWDRFS